MGREVSDQSPFQPLQDLGWGSEARTLSPPAHSPYSSSPRSAVERAPNVESGAWDKVLLLSPTAKQMSRKTYSLSGPQLSRRQNGHSFDPNQTEPLRESGARSLHQTGLPSRLMWANCRCGNWPWWHLPLWPVGLLTWIRDRVKFRSPGVTATLDIYYVL